MIISNLSSDSFYREHRSDILIIGAGMSGLTAGKQLQSEGFSVSVVDKGRGFGGRMATRRLEGCRFDHGTQYFTVESDAFQKAVKYWKRAGWVQPWFDQLPTHASSLESMDTVFPTKTRYIASEGMAGLAKHLAMGLNVFRSTKIERLEVSKEGWMAIAEADGDKQSVFYAKSLIITVPVPQALALFNSSAILLHSDDQDALQHIHYDPAHALMLAFDADDVLPTLSDSGGLAFTGHPSLRWLANNSQKGDLSKNPLPQTWTLHTTPEFSKQALQEDESAIYSKLMEALEKALHVELPTPKAWQFHRWSYSLVSRSHNKPFMRLQQLPACFVAGDAFGGDAKLETAFLSGRAVADCISDALNF